MRTLLSGSDTLGYNLFTDSTLTTVWGDGGGGTGTVVGSGESAEGFGGDYSLPNNAYCESCSGAGMVFFQHRMNTAFADGKYANILEETLYNAVLSDIDLEGQNFTYTNALDTDDMRYKWHVCPCCVGNIPRTLPAGMEVWPFGPLPEGVQPIMTMEPRVNTASHARNRRGAAWCGRWCCSVEMTGFLLNSWRRPEREWKSDGGTCRYLKNQLGILPASRRAVGPSLNRTDARLRQDRYLPVMHGFRERHTAVAVALRCTAIPHNSRTS